MIVVPDNLTNMEGCVYKLKYNGMFIIVMAKTLVRSVASINNDIGRYIKNTKLGREEWKYKGVDLAEKKKPAPALYSQLCKYVNDHPDQAFEIEIILEHSNPYQLLKATQIALDEAKENPYCLNVIFEPYQSPDIQRPSNSRQFTQWINRGHYLNFKNWQKRRSKNKGSSV